MTDEPFTRTYELGRAIGIQLGKHQERERILKIVKDYAPHLITSGLIEQIERDQSE